MNRKAFFKHVRGKPFRHMMVARLSQNQVNGCNVILDEWERRGLSDLRHLAYILATAYHETAHTMQPVREYGKGRGRRYGRPAANGKVYYGRGHVQLTWDYNYKKMGELLGLDLYNNPDLALNPSVSVKIMFEGMIRGSFTGKKLSDYLNASRTDWRQARKIINGMDKADLIAGYAKQFYAALLASQDAEAVTPDVEPVADDEPEVTPPKKTGITEGAAVVGAGGIGATALEIWGHIKEAPESLWTAVANAAGKPAFWAFIGASSLAGAIIYIRHRYKKKKRAE